MESALKMDCKFSSVYRCARKLCSLDEGKVELASRKTTSSLRCLFVIWWHSLLRFKHHLFPLAPPRDQPFLTMFAFILSPPFDCGQLLALNLPGFLHILWYMAVACNPPYLRHVLVALLKCFIILEFLALPRRLDTPPFRGVSTPQPDIAVIGTREQKLRVGREFRREHSATG